MSSNRHIIATFLSLVQKPRHGVVIIFVVSVLLAFSFKLLLPAQFRLEAFSDQGNFYEPVARNILAGKGFTADDGGPATFQGPGHPAILAGSYALAGWLGIPENTLLDALVFTSHGLTSVFVLLMARRIWQPLPAFLAALVWATYPFNLWFVQYFSSEYPFMALMLGGMCLLWHAVTRRRRGMPFFISGVLFGLAALVRPIGIGLGLLSSVVLWLASRERRGRARWALACIPAVASALTILPWILWVYSMTGQIVPIASSGEHSLLGGFTYALNHTEFQVDTVPTDVLALQRRIHDSRPQSTGEVVAVLANELRTDPQAVVKLLLLKVARSWYGTYSGRHEALALVLQIPYLLLVGVGIWGTWKRSDTARLMVAGHVLLVLYFWLMSSLVVSNLRYMVPTLGLLFIFIPGMAHRLLGRQMAGQNALNHRGAHFNESSASGIDSQRA